MKKRKTKTMKLTSLEQAVVKMLREQADEVDYDVDRDYGQFTLVFSKVMPFKDSKGRVSCALKTAGGSQAEDGTPQVYEDMLDVGLMKYMNARTEELEDAVERISAVKTAPIPPGTNNEQIVAIVEKALDGNPTH